MSRCGICKHDKPLGGAIGHLEVCGDCYNDYGTAKKRAEQNERLIVAMDRELETDERLNVVRAQLEVAHDRIRKLERFVDRLNKRRELDFYLRQSMLDEDVEGYES